MTSDVFRKRIADGVLAYPVTPFHDNLTIDIETYSSHLSWLMGFGPSGYVPAGGAGEFHALSIDEMATLVRSTRAIVGDAPIICGCGLGMPMAKTIALTAQNAGADAILLMPPYLVACPPMGLEKHVRAICSATDLFVIIYNRANAQFDASTVECLATSCPNLVGFKDGSGDVMLVREVAARLGDRLLLIGGMPTHEIYAESYFGAGAKTYSSALFNFAPRLSLQFYDAVMRRDRSETDRLLLEFLFPFARIRARAPGYAVSILKAGLRLIGRSVGPVRPPLMDLTANELELLRPLIHQHVDLPNFD